MYLFSFKTIRVDRLYQYIDGTCDMNSVGQARPRINCKRRNKIFFLFLWVFEKKLLFLCFYGRRAGTSDLFVNIYFLRLSMANSSLYN